MNERELLELAARAAGYLNWTPMQSCLFIETGHSRGNTGFHWNPLTDDGDALRLAVKLEIDVVHAHGTRTAVAENTSGYAAEGSDPYAATRRAIVSVAAEIGKGMK